MKKKAPVLTDVAVCFDEQPTSGLPLAAYVSFTVIDLEPVLIRDVCVRIEGKSRVVFVDSALTGVKERQIFCVETQCGNDRNRRHSGLTCLELGPGQHKLPIKFLVPSQAPNSFSGKYGIVRYQITAKITLVDPNAASFECTSEFYVERNENLNWYQDALLPVIWKQNHNRRTCGIKRLDIFVFLKLNTSGCTLGDDITINGEIVNLHKRRSVDGSTVQLVQRIVYRIGLKLKTTKTVIARAFMGPIEPDSMQAWEDVRLTVPTDAPPSFLRGCDDIFVAYEVTVTVAPGGVKLSTPIIVGTLPFTPNAIGSRVVDALPCTSMPNVGKVRLHGRRYNSLHELSTPPPEPHLFGRSKPSFFRIPRPFRFGGGVSWLLHTPAILTHFGRKKPKTAWSRRTAFQPPLWAKSAQPYDYYGHERYDSQAETDDNEVRVLKIEEIVD